MFPAPTSSYTSSGFIGDIIYIPKYKRCEHTQERKQFEKLEKDDVDLNDRIMEIAMSQQQEKADKKIIPAPTDGQTDGTPSVTPKALKLMQSKSEKKKFRS